jgi:plasmid maintenance system antidote protein VapI
VKFDPDWVVAPGATLQEWFDDVRLPLAVGAHYGISERTLRRLFAGKQKITPALAQKLCNLTQVGAPFWLALEHNFRVGLAAGKYWEGGKDG